MIRTILYSLWLPVLVIVVSVIRFGFNTPLEGPGFMGITMLLMSVVTLFALAWPAAIPLTLAVRLLHRRSQVLAYVCALILGAGSVLGSHRGRAFRAGRRRCIRAYRRPSCLDTAGNSCQVPERRHGKPAIQGLGIASTPGLTSVNGQ